MTIAEAAGLAAEQPSLEATDLDIGTMQLQVKLNTAEAVPPSYVKACDDLNIDRDSPVIGDFLLKLATS